MSVKKTIKKYLLRIACATVLSPKSFSVIPDGIREIRCRSEDMHLLTATSNNVCRVKADGRLLYFRECKIHKEIHEYVNDGIDFYYTRLKPDCAQDGAFIKSKLSVKANFKRFVNMGMTNDKTSGAYHFCMGNGARYIGLDGMTPDMEERVKDFVQFIWGDLFAYQLNGGLKKGKYQTYNAVRSIAQYRMAGLIGAPELIPETEYAKICVDGETAVFGTVMAEARGFSAERMDEKTSAALVSPSLQRSLNRLHLLDVLCLEKDHRPGNYNVVAEDGRVTGLAAFDNDSPNSFGIGGISFGTYIGCSPLIKKRRLNRPYIDADIAEQIERITNADIDRVFSDVLNVFQMMTLKKRLRQLKRIIGKLPETARIRREAWSEDTIKQELLGTYGETYLSKFIEKRDMPYQPWLKRE